MSTHPDNILPYAPPPNRRKALRALARRFLISLLVVGIPLFICYYALIHGPTSGQVRLDSGDIRYCWFGIPLYYERMPEPCRSKILALKSAVPAKWVTFDKNPWQSEHDLTNRYRYDLVADWADADPNIARLAVADLADDIEHSPWCPTKSHMVLSPGALSLDWRDNDDVKTYCATHAYTPAPAPGPKP